ncbi:putative hydrolase or acyltransferase of alpha/beta superfamily [Actinobacteria bacterium IMCC26207]|nr:putative hydrolase or acyltransferase of alpha/beta superfamily [Actinobacteria bacterium IMCC26207]
MDHPALGASPGSTFVLVHGSNHGGWCWERVTPLLEAAGHSVYTPTLTGLAERADELTQRVGLATHVADITELFEREDLREVTLVGHSYAGAVITGAAEAVAERISRLIYLDAFLPRDGESVLDIEPPQSREAFLSIARDQGDGWRLPPQQSFLDRWGLTDPADRKWVWENLTDMPLLASTEPLSALRDAARSLPGTFIDLTAPKNAGTVPATERALEEGLKMLAIATGHDAMVTEPARLAELLLQAP